MYVCAESAVKSVSVNLEIFCFVISIVE